ncbi:MULTISPECIES: hypothetical protein [Sorangium]|uniref:Secreted protein n=1 Tax=Sorangium cellulosum TaxID=56 RepID=A0A4P2QMH2_SORCE|nr:MULTISPECIES: hypothetical protein [Sorangium]AUX31185.1 hypothetical protein SOCE836_033130 [Sorangium cellulosum]WCQ90568.1 hypothetical protein NQZ70_03279 [Sorangium sp. Soce836]
MRGRGRALALAAVAAGALVAAPARAQGVGDMPMRPEDRGYVALYGVFSASPQDGEQATAHVAPQVAAGARLNGWLSATADVTAAWTTFEVEGEARRSSFRFGNPFVTLQAALVEGRGRAIHAGLGAAPPLTTFPGTIPANTEVEYNYAVASAARGFADPWMWAPNAIPVVLLLRSRAELLARVVLGAELDPAVLVSVNSNPSRLAIVAAAHAGLRLGPLTPGLRVQMFAQSAPLAGRNFSQWSAALYAHAELEAVFVRAQGVVNVDAPFGLAGQRGATVWGASLGGGLRL